MPDETQPDTSARIEDRIARSQDHPDRIGPFKILEVLGEGGMGVVYLAEQTEPIRRRVALKLVKLGMDTRQTLARFESERQALALMNHANVARVLDAGATEAGRPYFVMEHVAGVPITEYCDQHCLNTIERLELFTQVCQAVQHAHQKGIIHRDIKPSNVLVTVRDGEPLPKVIDFGVAKATEHRLTEKTLFTEQGQLIGTPDYMSPEQAEMSGLDVDTRTDIYSLGVLLYELLVGALPFDPTKLRRAGFAGIQQVIRQQEPPKPSTRLSGLGDASGAVSDKRRTDIGSLTRQLRGDLDWIIMKAMDKDRTRRYATAAELAEDIARHLGHEPVKASPPSPGYRFRKFVRRNKGLVVGVCVVIAVLLAGVVTSTSMYLRAERARRTAEQERLAAEQARNREAEARNQAQQKARELEKVTEFQQNMLSDVDALAMGRGIIDDLRRRARLRLAERNPGGTEITDALAGFDAAIDGVNVTDLALKVIDERILAEAHDAVEREFDHEPHIQTALRRSIASTYQEIGLYSKAESLHRKTLAAQRLTLGEAHADTLRTKTALAFTLERSARYLEAESLHREVLEERRRALGVEDPRTLFSLNGLAWVLIKQNRWMEAEQLCRETYGVCQRVLGEGHQTRMHSLHNLATVVEALEDHAEAEVLWRRLLAQRTHALGAESPGTLWAMLHLSLVLSEQGKYDEARRMARKSVETRRRILGEDHRDTLWALSNLGRVLADERRYAEAETYARRAVETGRRTLGDTHSDLLWWRERLADVLFAQGKLELARTVFSELILQRRLATERPNADAGTWHRYTWALLVDDEPRDPYVAVDAAKRAISLSGEKEPHFLATLAAAYRKAGDTDKAIATRQEALDALSPCDTADRAQREAWLAGWFERVGDLESAEYIRRASPDRPREWLPDQRAKPPVDETQTKESR